MGAWGTAPFENDTALDWFGAFVDAPDRKRFLRKSSKETVVVSALSAAANPEDGLGIYNDIGQEGIAAAEVVAALAGRPGPEIARREPPIEELCDWIRANAPAFAKDAHVIALARAAVERVLDGSGLAETWADSKPEYEAAWRAGVEDLLARLG